MANRLPNASSAKRNIQAEIRQKVASGEAEQLRQALAMVELLPAPASGGSQDAAAQTLYELVLHAESLGDWEGCAALYRRVASYDVTNPHIRGAAWFRYGLCRERVDELSEALDAYRRALVDAAGWSLVTGLARWRLALLLTAAEEFEEAAGLLRDLLSDLPHPEIRDDEVRLMQARCLWQLGRGRQACAVLSGLPPDASRGLRVDADSHTTAELRPTPLRSRTPPVALSPRLLLTGADEGRFVVIANDSGISRTIVDSGSWAREDIAVFKRLVRPGQTVLDIGANIGHHSVVFSRLVGPGGRVLCFEPQSFLFNVLCANLALNDCFRARAFPLALGDTDGRTRMLPVDYERPDNFGALGLSVHSEWCTGEEVHIAKLDTFLNEQGVATVDFIKVDVQTFELFVLRGATETLTRNSPLLFIEISPFWMQRMSEYDYRDVYRLLAGLGYQLFDKHFRPLDPGCESCVDEDIEWDILASKLPLQAQSPGAFEGTAGRGQK
jgi:FkbM family methyltransferase